MSGNAFVVSDRFVVDERALGEVGSGDNNAAGALAIRGAGDVVSCSSGLKGRDCLDRDRRFREQSEELGKLRLHLGDVVAKIVEDLIGGCRNVFWIGFE